jgi:hypothetical protein
LPRMYGSVRSFPDMYALFAAVVRDRVVKSDMYCSYREGRTHLETRV